MTDNHRQFVYSFSWVFFFFPFLNYILYITLFAPKVIFFVFYFSTLIVLRFCSAIIEQHTFICVSEAFLFISPFSRDKSKNFSFILEIEIQFFFVILSAYLIRIFCSNARVRKNKWFLRVYIQMKPCKHSAKLHGVFQYANTIDNNYVDKRTYDNRRFSCAAQVCQ